jgi:Galactose oxidase, central domain
MDESGMGGFENAAMTRRQLLKGGMGAGVAVAAAITGLVPVGALANLTQTAGVWHRLSPATSPSTRAYSAMTYDPARRNVVLFGGLRAPADTWVYSNDAWNLVDTPGPSSRFGSAIAFDTITDRVILFGGLGAGALYSDTWAWDGHGWTELTPRLSPAARVGGALAHDPITGRLVLFGGYGDGRMLSDTWVWTGRSWSEVTSDTRPPTTAGATLGVDPATRTLMLTGGSHGPTGVPPGAETWQWTGSTWRLWASDATSAQLVFAASAESPDSFARFGGLANGSPTDSGVISEKGSTVAMGPIRPAPRAYASMAYEPASQGLILFGGQSEQGFLNDSWLWVQQ